MATTQINERTPLNFKPHRVHEDDGSLTSKLRRLARHRHVKRVGLLAALSLAVAVGALVIFYHNGKFYAGDTDSNEPPKELLFCEAKDQYDSGYIKLANKNDDYYFYWLVQSRDTPAEDPLVLWLTGGPGCSSMMALFQENGPCHVDDNLQTTKNLYSWTNNANVLWLDQPSGVGFSYGAPEDEDHNETNVGENLYWFMQGFLEKHPEFENRDFYVTGESYAGHYVPTAAHYLMKNMRDDNSTSMEQQRRVNLKGIAIGNGLTDPAIQFAHALDMVDNAYNVTLLTPNETAHARESVPECVHEIEACQRNTSTCLNATLFCMQNVMYSLLTTAGRNPYDIRQECDVSTTQNPTSCYNVTNVAEYLDSEPVRQLLHVNTTNVPKWRMCSLEVTLSFVLSGDTMQSFSDYVRELLEEHVRVLIYAGDADLQCNWYGNQAWTRALQWSGHDDFNAAPVKPFIVHDSVTDQTINAGTVQSTRNGLTFLRVFNAGHMVPMDQPAVALDILDRFLQDKPFYDDIK